MKILKLCSTSFSQALLNNVRGIRGGVSSCVILCGLRPVGIHMIGSMNSLGLGYAYGDYEQKSLVYLFKKKKGLYYGSVMPECS